MTSAEWLAAQLAAAPPLSQAQLAVLRPIFRPAIPLMTGTAPAAQRGPCTPATTATPGKEPGDA